jgi:hypothetical protein
VSVDSILRLGRKRREQLMRSTCRITRPGGEQVWNPATGDYDIPAETTIYEGKCQIKPTSSPAERDGSAGDRDIVLQSYTLVLPWDAPGPVNVADAVDILSGDDTWANGQRFPVGWVEHADTRTHRRIIFWTQDRGVVNSG